MLLALSICLLLGITSQTSFHEETKSMLLDHSKAIQYLMNKDQDNIQSLINLQVQVGQTASKVEEFGESLNKTRSDVDIISGTETNLELLKNQITVINSQVERLARNSQLEELKSLKEAQQTLQDLNQQLQDAQTQQQQSLQNVKTGLEDKQAQIQELNNQIQSQISSLGDLKTNLENPQCPQGMVMVGSDQNAFCIHPESQASALSYLESQEFCLDQGLNMCTVAQTQSAIRLHKLKTTSFWREDMWYVCSDVDHDFYLLTQGNYDQPDAPLYDVGAYYLQDKHPWQRTVCCSGVTHQI